MNKEEKGKCPDCIPAADLVGSSERRAERGHLVDQAAQRPHVGLVVVGPLLAQLGREVPADGDRRKKKKEKRKKERKSRHQRPFFPFLSHFLSPILPKHAFLFFHFFIFFYFFIFFF
jgi:hypothetical protein